MIVLFVPFASRCFDVHVSFSNLSCFVSVDINPNGRSYASGAEDGYVRLHHFDKDYLDMKDPVPEEGEEDDEDDNEGLLPLPASQ